MFPVPRERRPDEGIHDDQSRQPQPRMRGQSSVGMGGVGHESPLGGGAVP